MRIAQFAESYRPVINGAAVAVVLIADALAARHHVEVFAPRFPGHTDPPGGRIVHRFPSYCVPGHADYPLAVPFSPTLASAFRRGAFDVVHTHSPFALGQAGRRWARRAGIPVVMTYHTLYVEYAHYARPIPVGVSRAFLRGVTRRYCNACDAIAVPTGPIRDVLLGYGVTRPIAVIPTGLRLRERATVDPAFPRGQLGIPQNAPLVLFAGRLAPEKNLKLLFAAFTRVLREIPDAWLLLAGDGPERDACQRWAAETGAPERVVLAGFIAPERMPPVYAAADVFAFCSRTDTQGMVLIEAKAGGLPAVAVNAFGPTEIVNNGVDGFLVPDDPDAFGDALVRVLSDADLRGRMSAAACQDVQRFSIEETVRAYERLYGQAGTAACHR